MKIRELLVATDLSRETQQTYTWTIEFARAHKSRVVLVHVAERLDSGHFTTAALLDYYGAHDDFAGRRLADEKERLTSLGLTVETVQVTGTPSKEILRLAHTQRFDLVVMGHRTAPDFDVHLLGSNTRRVAGHIKTPLLVVPIVPHQESPQDQVDEGEDRVLKLLAPLDFSSDSSAGLDVALQLATTFGAMLDVCNVLALPRLLDSLPGEAPGLTATTVAELLAATKRQLEDEITSRMGPESARERVACVVLQASNPARAIVELSRSRRADLIVVPTHGKGTLKAAILGSTSKRLLRMADRPVLILPRAYLQRITADLTGYES